MQAIPHRPDTERNHAINRLLIDRSQKELQLETELRILKGFFAILFLIGFTAVMGWQ